VPADREIFGLIAAFLAAVRVAVETLRPHVGEGSMLQNVRANPSLRRGALPGGVDYYFHGIGCAFTRDGRTVDFNFGPAGEINGFDAWRLWLFAEQDPERFPQWQTESAITGALDELVHAGLAHAAFRESRLLFLTDAGEACVVTRAS
jgi:hypothetical protein